VDNLIIKKVTDDKKIILTFLLDGFFQCLYIFKRQP
jgi:hypothetical protein